MVSIGKQFDELAEEVPSFADDLRMLSTLLEFDNPTALNKMRFITEKLLYGLCLEHEIDCGGRKHTLETMIGPLTARGIVPRNVAVYVRTVQLNASPGSHYQEQALDDGHVMVAGLSLARLLRWAVTEGQTVSRSPVSRSSGGGNRLGITLVFALLAIAAVAFTAHRLRLFGGEVDESVGGETPLPIARSTAPPELFSTPVSQDVHASSADVMSGRDAGGFAAAVGPGRVTAVDGGAELVPSTPRASTTAERGVENGSVKKTVQARSGTGRRSTSGRAPKPSPIGISIVEAVGTTTVLARTALNGLEGPLVGCYQKAAARTVPPVPLRVVVLFAPTGLVKSHRVTPSGKIATSFDACARTTLKKMTVPAFSGHTFGTVRLRIGR